MIALIGAVLFGSLGNFLGFVTGIFTGFSDTVNGNEGYVYNGGSIADYVSQGSSGNGASSNSIVDGSSGNKTGSGLLGSSGSNSASSEGSGSSGGSGGSGSSGGSTPSSDVVYEDYQKDYSTGMVDSEGNPIILSIVSTSGGQELVPGIYQVYWSAAGPINQTRIG